MSSAILSTAEAIAKAPITGDFYAHSHRFLVQIFAKKNWGFTGNLQALNVLPTVVDFRFQRISGLGRTIQTQKFHQGGDPINQIHLPKELTQENIVLERGVTTLSPLTTMFIDTMRQFKSRYLVVVILLLDSSSLPLCSWICMDALPVKLQWGELDATSNTVLLNTMELACRDVQWMGLVA
ncbi:MULTISPECIES: phage tail protein [Burkholderiaceae]|uniref:phage tail protein n=1 Tax=Burkholderiaceae TaxID=119060 RepID=UPI0009682561|nr:MULTISPECIES: phage tail protein [Burkholderiaceae]MCG1038054.1 phage tail protein [Mycetohabitans sp. B7]SIT75604.1 conserved hypothetical phage tail region protein [Burkholderia sp. b14]